MKTTTREARKLLEGKTNEVKTLSEMMAKRCGRNRITKHDVKFALNHLKKFSWLDLYIFQMNDIDRKVKDKKYRTPLRQKSKALKNFLTGSPSSRYYDAVKQKVDYWHFVKYNIKKIMFL